MTKLVGGRGSGTSIMTLAVAPRRLSARDRQSLRVLLIAKHARSDGAAHPDDGTHAVYHHEMRTTLEALGVNLQLATDHEALFGAPDVDFVFPLLNRAGFLNSEMLVPLLCERLKIPYLGSSPILRGLADDKHLAKQAAAAMGIATAPWAVFRRGAAIELDRAPQARRHVVKPNASSASWGVNATEGSDALHAAVSALHAEGHDAIVEPFVSGHDLEVSVITLDGQPLILPTQIVRQDDPGQLRTYREKRNLVGEQAYRIELLADGRVRDTAEAMTRRLLRDYQPFDYGRFEFRLDEASGAVGFMEVNLNCNLWSRKTIAIAAAAIGWNHAELIETILAESLGRQGMLSRKLDLAA